MKQLPRLAVLAALAVVLGCGSGTAPTEGTTGDGVPAADEQATPPERWLVWLIDIRRRVEFPAAIVEVSDGKAELLDSLVGEADSISLADGEFHLRSTDEEQDTFDIVATGTSGELRGNAVIDGASSIWPIRLEPTEEKSLEALRPDSISGVDAFGEALSEPTPKGLEDFVKSRSTSAMALLASEALIAASQREELDDEAVRGRAAAYEKLAEKWGDRYVAYARVRSPLVLARVGYAPQLARKLADSAKEGLDEDLAKSWEPILDELDQKLAIAEATLALTGEDESARDDARTKLEAMVAEDSAMSEVAYLLAEDAERRGDKERALALYGEIVALPGLEASFWRAASSVDEEVELPSDRFDRLWKELRGEDATDEDRELFLSKRYEERAFVFADEEKRVEPSGNRVSLVELFTGTTCPPCVAADIAVGGVEKLYGHEEVVALRYHQHIPGPDPFANSATETRFAYYAALPPERTGTPTTIVNGEKILVAGGFDFAILSFETLLQALEPALFEKTDVVVTVEAEARSDKLRVKATAAGLPADAKGLRLRVVLAETLVRYPARNGVRLHEMVVRAMPAGVDGLALDGESGEFETTIDLPAMKAGLLKDLADTEEVRLANFPAKPMPFEGFHVVAFVQDDTTKAVLQAGAVEVEGKLVFEADGPALEPPSETPADEPKEQPAEEPAPAGIE